MSQKWRMVNQDIWVGGSPLREKSILQNSRVFRGYPARRGVFIFSDYMLK